MSHCRVILVLVLIFFWLALLACFALRLWTTISFMDYHLLWWQVFRLALVILQTHLFYCRSHDLGFKGATFGYIYFLLDSVG